MSYTEITELEYDDYANKIYYNNDNELIRFIIGRQTSSIIFDGAALVIKYDGAKITFGTNDECYNYSVVAEINCEQKTIVTDIVYEPHQILITTDTGNISILGGDILYVLQIDLSIINNVYAEYSKVFKPTCNINIRNYAPTITLYKYRRVFRSNNVIFTQIFDNYYLHGYNDTYYIIDQIDGIFEFINR